MKEPEIHIIDNDTRSSSDSLGFVATYQRCYEDSAVYYIVDTTDLNSDGMWYHVGIFSSYQKAIQWLYDLDHPYTGGEVEYEQTFEVRKYVLDKTEWSGTGKLVAKALLYEAAYLNWEINIEEVSS